MRCNINSTYYFSCHRFMHVKADIQMPSLSLKDSKLRMKDSYVGIPAQYQIILCNNTIIPTQYIWKAQVC